MTVLLSLSDSQNRAMDLLAWSMAEKVKLDTKVKAVFRAWLSDWGLDDPTNAESLSDASTRNLSIAEMRTALGRQLVGAESVVLVRIEAQRRSAGPSVAESVAAAAWQDWIDRIREICGNANDPLEAFAVTTWDGALAVSLQWWQGVAQIHVDAKHVAELLGDRQKNSTLPVPGTSKPSLVPLIAAMAHEKIQIQTNLPAVTLTLGEIQGLRVGDIVPLSHGLDERIAVLLNTSDSATHLCSAWLGQRHGQIAIELAK